jgi:glycosyltransferase involved in cell wall biosynthesis
VHPSFQPRQSAEVDELEASENFVMYHGPLHTEPFSRLLEAWSWAAGSIGSSHPLLIAGASPAQRSRLEKQISESGLEQSIRLLPTQSIKSLAALYLHCTAFFYPNPTTGWADPLRHALACGVPVVACSDPLSEALAGPAAYLAPPGDSRQLGAGLLTMIFAETLGENIASAARQRAAAWRCSEFAPSLWDLYQSLILQADA